METFDGPTYALLFENIPGGPAAHLAELSYDDDPAGFLDAVLAVMKEFHPHTYDRVDLATFALHDDKALMQGAIRPVVRTSYAVTDSSTPVIAIGDLRVTLDPVTGAGANLGSYGAAVLAEHIAAHARRLRRRLRGTVRASRSSPNGRNRGVQRSDSGPAGVLLGTVHGDGVQPGDVRRVHRGLRQPRTSLVRHREGCGDRRGIRRIAHPGWLGRVKERTPAGVPVATTRAIASSTAVPPRVQRAERATVMRAFRQSARTDLPALADSILWCRGLPCAATSAATVERTF